jgi:hypothetical protein
MAHETESKGNFPVENYVLRKLAQVAKSLTSNSIPVSTERFTLAFPDEFRDNALKYVTTASFHTF